MSKTKISAVAEIEAAYNALRELQAPTCIIGLYIRKARELGLQEITHEFMEQAKAEDDARSDVHFTIPGAIRVVLSHTPEWIKKAEIAENALNKMTHAQQEALGVIIPGWELKIREELKTMQGYMWMPMHCLSEQSVDLFDGRKNCAHYLLLQKGHVDGHFQFFEDFLLRLRAYLGQYDSAAPMVNAKLETIITRAEEEKAYRETMAALAEAAVNGKQKAKVKIPKPPGARRKPDPSWAQIARDMKANGTQHKEIAAACGVIIRVIEQFFERERKTPR